MSLRFGLAGHTSDDPVVNPDSGELVSDSEREFRTNDAQIVRSLTQVSRAFTYATSLQEILDLAADQAAKMLGVDKSVLMLADDDGMLRVRASYGVQQEIVDQFGAAFSESLVRRLRGLLGAHLAEGFIGVPLVTQGKVIGLLAIVRPEGQAPAEDDEWLLSALADQVAAPLENARLARQLEHVALLTENVRLYEAERAARQEAERARLDAEAARREAEAARDTAVQADQSKSAFLAAMSHELRTPLNAIGGYIQLLEMEIRGPVTPEQAQDLDRVKTNQRHLLRLISEVLEFAKVGAGQLEYEITAVSLESALSETDAMVMPQVVSKGLQYTREVCPEGLAILADTHRLQQIVLNLVSNAIKFTSEGGMIRVRCETVTGTTPLRELVRVHVTDNGLGIPADKIDSVFDPFVQVERRLNQPVEGIGLGLAISRELARGLGGDLTVMSEMGVGSTFTLTLPRV